MSSPSSLPPHRDHLAPQLLRLALVAHQGQEPGQVELAQRGQQVLFADELDAQVQRLAVQLLGRVVVAKILGEPGDVVQARGQVQVLAAELAADVQGLVQQRPGLREQTEAAIHVAKRVQQRGPDGRVAHVLMDAVRGSVEDLPGGELLAGVARREERVAVEPQRVGRLEHAGERGRDLPGPVGFRGRLAFQLLRMCSRRLFLLRGLDGLPFQLLGMKPGQAFLLGRSQGTLLGLPFLDLGGRDGHQGDGRADHQHQRQQDHRGREPRHRRVAPGPAAEPFGPAHRPGVDRLPFLKAGQVIRQFRGAGVALPRLLAQTF